jgi:hypothetical protein
MKLVLFKPQQPHKITLTHILCSNAFEAQTRQKLLVGTINMPKWSYLKELEIEINLAPMKRKAPSYPHL